MAYEEFSKLNVQINKLDESIAKLETRVKGLQTVMASANWGEAQLKEFQSQLNLLTSTLERQRAQKVNLISEKDVSSINTVLKSISTLETKLKDLYAKKSGTDVLSRDFREVEKSIKNSETALKSFQSQLANKYGAQRPIAPAPTATVRDDFLGQPGQPPVGGLTPTNRDRENSAAAKREAAEKERLLALQKSVLAEKKYARALEIAAQQNFNLEHLTRVQTRGTGGVEQLRFQRTGDIGEQRQLDVFAQPSGRATPGISNQFRTFSQGVGRDIGELAKWSIALAAIYGPMRKLQELTETMIENQTKLAEAAISVSSSFADQGDIFDAAAAEANAAGEEITGVIDAFTLAFRATGGAGTEVERFSTANRLLADSLTLSKLSSLDQAQAIDTLAAALRQTTGDLDNGSQLLDKWVRVTKEANVDLTTLATGFAVLGDAAEAAQINVDQLNGIIAGIAETGVSSAKESANVARSLVSGFQSDNARKELESLGIAVENTSGQMRPFLEIMQEIYNLRQAKIIDDTQFSRLTLALGGGTRRQAAYTTFIENFDRVFEVADESSRASGEAEAALAKQLETVQTSLTRLGNSFEELAQTMGTEGGFLGIVTESVDAMTGLVGAFEDIISLLGKATPAMAAFAATAAVLKYKGVEGGLQGAVGGLGQRINIAPTGVEARLNQLNPQAGINSRQSFLQNNILGTNAISGAIQGALVSAIPALLNATNEGDKFGGTKATANIIGGVGGGVVGALVAGSPIIGAAVGTAISEAFISSTVARKTDIFGYAEPTLGEPFGKQSTEQDLDEALRAAEAGLYESIGFGEEALGKLFTSMNKSIKNLIEDINKSIEEGDRGRFETLTKVGAIPLGQAGISQQQLQSAFEQRRPLQITEEQLAYQKATPEARRAYDEALSARTAKGDVQDIATPFKELVNQNKLQFDSLLRSITERSRNELTGQRVSGEVTGADYTRRVQALGTFDVKALQYYTALGEELINVNDQVDDSADAFNVLNEIIVSGASDSVPEITSIVTEIQNLVNLLNDPVLNEDALEKTFGGVDEARRKLEELRQTGANLIGDVYSQSLVGQLQVPDIAGDINKPRTTDEAGQIYQEGLKLQGEFLSSLGLTADEMEAFTESLDDYAQRVQDGGETFYQVFEGLAGQFRSAAEKALEEAGKITEGGDKGIGFQQFDFTRAQIESAAQRSLQIGAQWQQAFGYGFKPETQIAVDSSGFAEPLQADFKIMQLLLQELVDQGQKMLDGQYNIPEGATFWVPLTAAYYRNKGGDGAGGGLGAGIGGPEVESNTSATQLNTAALHELTANMVNRFKGGEFGGRLDQRVVKTGEDFDQSAASLTGANNVYPKSIIKPLVSLTGEPNARGVEPKTPFSLSNVFNDLTSDLSILFGDIANSIKESFSAPFGAPGRDGRESGAAPNGPIAKLDLKIDSNTQLIVDARVLATSLKSFFAADLVRTQEATGIVTRRFVI